MPPRSYRTPRVSPDGTCNPALVRQRECGAAVILRRAQRETGAGSLVAYRDRRRPATVSSRRFGIRSVPVMVSIVARPAKRSSTLRSF